MALKSCVTIYLDDDVLAQVKEVADYNCRSVSAVIRSAVDSYLYCLHDDSECNDDADRRA